MNVKKNLISLVLKFPGDKFDFQIKKFIRKFLRLFVFTKTKEEFIINKYWGIGKHFWILYRRNGKIIDEKRFISYTKAETYMKNKYGSKIKLKPFKHKWNYHNQRLLVTWSLYGPVAQSGRAGGS